MIPEIRETKYTIDFSCFFYCTNNYEQSYKWADRKSQKRIVNVYSYIMDDHLKIREFDKMTDEWLDFIGKCKNKKENKFSVKQKERKRKKDVSSEDL